MFKVEKVEKEEKKSTKSKKNKKISESENTPALTQSAPKVDNKIQEQKAQKKNDNIEVSDNTEEKGSAVMETQGKSGAVFDELGGNYFFAF